MAGYTVVFLSAVRTRAAPVDSVFFENVYEVYITSYTRQPECGGQSLSPGGGDIAYMHAATSQPGMRRSLRICHW